MRSFVLAFASLLTTLGGVFSLVAVADEPPKTVLTEKDFDKEVSLKRGDIVEVRLPAQMPLEWAQSQPNPLLSELDGYPKFEDAPRPDKQQVLGAPGFTVHRFQIVGVAAKPAEFRLIYSKFGKPTLTAQRIKNGSIPKPEAFRPDQKTEDLREGMVYHFKLKTAE
jgi:hypothetical protein